MILNRVFNRLNVDGILYEPIWLINFAFLIQLVSLHLAQQLVKK